MADLVLGAMGSLIPKLGELLEEEYNLQTGVKERVSSLTQDLEGAQAALRKVAQVPWDQLDEQVKLWAREVREASYDMEDVLDTYLVHVQGSNSAEQECSLKRLGEKMANLFKKSRARRKISGDVKDIMSHLQEVMERCRRYKVDDIVARPATASTVDPRLEAMYTQVKKLVGIDKSSGELISMIRSPQRDDESNKKLKIVSIVGVGGLGKTTLAKAVYDKLKVDFDCGAFVSVGRTPDLQKVIQGILIKLDQQKYMQFNFSLLHEISEFIDVLRGFLLDKEDKEDKEDKKNKRYFIVIDDIWEIQSWETIKLAIDVDNDCGGRIIITTRKLEVAKKADEVYELQPLPHDSSRKLFYTRISDDKGKYVYNPPDEISDKILRKCGGIPLAIITMASLLVDKPREQWSELYKSIGFGCKGNEEAENTMIILSLSYYDLPSHLRTCLLYLSAFPEDSFIPKDALVLKWVAEGFVHEKQGIRLFEIGERYLNDLINRSMIQEVTESDYDDSFISGCCVHDMVLDFIRSMSIEEIFFTVLDNGQDTLPQSNVRWLAHHNRPMVHPGQANRLDMPKVRSFSAHKCVIETWVPLSSFKLLRVLAVENCSPTGDCGICIEHLGHLLHLRYLSLLGTKIDKIPEEIGALRFLQTLDLSGSSILELPSSISLLTQLVCLRITFDDAPDAEVVSVVGRLTSLEELSIAVRFTYSTSRWFVLRELCSLRELRVLETSIFGDDEESERDFLQSLPPHHKLQHLVIRSYSNGRPKWEAAGFVLPRHLRHLAVHGVVFFKLPSGINPSCLPNLSHLDLTLDDMDEQDLKILGGLPELHYLTLHLRSSATISNVSDSDAGYFLKLRCCRLTRSMVFFLANKEDKSISFHMWSGRDDIAMPSDSDDESQRPTPPDSDDESLQRPLIQHGLAALAYYFLAFFQRVLVFVKKRSLRHVGQRPLISNRGSAPGNGEDVIAMPSSSDDEKKGSSSSKGAAAPPFMPSLQVLHFRVHEPAVWDHRYCENLGLTYLSSLREISVNIQVPTSAYSGYATKLEQVKAALRRAEDVHPNHPTLCMKIRGAMIPQEGKKTEQQHEDGIHYSSARIN